MIEKLQRRFALSHSGAVDLIKACFACVLSNIALMFPVGLIYYFVRDITGNSLNGKAALYGIGAVLCILLIGITTYIQYNATFLATYKETGIRRISLAEKLRKIPLSFFGKKDLSDLTSALMADCASLETAFSHFIPEFIGSVISTVIVAVGLFAFDWRMALAATWVVPVSFIITSLSVKVQDSMGAKNMDAKLACADGIQECLETVCDLKSNNAEYDYLKGLDIKIKNVEKRAVISEFTTAAFVVSSQLVLKLGIASVAFAGSVLLVSGKINVLLLFMFLLVASRLYDPLQASLQNLAAIISTRVTVSHMNEILYHDVQTGSDTLTNKGYDVEFNNVGFSYNNEETVLKNVSFTAKQGEVTALIGPSGGGKTTVSRLAARFWDVSRGSVTVGGTDIKGIDPERLLSLYSIVFQDVTLFDNTILENIRIGKKDASDAEVIAAAKLANCDEFVKKLPDGYNSMIGENGCMLSGGERQRISIARAFLKDAPIILLDEATASLDVENETLVQNAVSRLIKDKTVLIIAHRMRTVAGADKIVVLKDGTVAEQGSPAELIDKGGVYAHMSALQSESAEWHI